MAKKYYAVRVGKVPGIYQTWDECKKNVHGFPAAEYKLHVYGRGEGLYGKGSCTGD